MSTLSDRQKRYNESYDYIVMPNIPVVVRAEVRNFSRLTRNLEKPYSPELWRIMRDTMLTSVMDIEGAILSYHHGAEISFILNGINNTSDFYSNKIQKIGTVVSSLCSVNFMKHFLVSDDPPDILGEAIFEVSVNGVPSVEEATDYMLWRQQIAVSNAVNAVVEAEMLKTNDKKAVAALINRKSIAEKKNLLHDECNVRYESYPSFFRLGSACYKVPKIIKSDEDETVKKKWNLDTDIPDFLDDKEFVFNIIETGQDVMRPDRDVVKQLAGFVDE